MPKIEEHAKNIAEVEERRRTFFLILHKTIEIIRFNVSC